MKIKLLKLLLMAVKLSFYGALVQMVFFTAITAGDLHAQKVESIREVLLDVKLENADLSKAFQIIEKKTAFKFAYDNVDLKRDVKVNFDMEKATVADLLLEISKTSNLKFRQVNDVINVHTSEQKLEQGIVEVVLQGTTVTGTIRSAEDDDGLPGVNVIVKGTTTGTVTDVSGNYSIAVPGPESILVFSSVGYIKEEATVGNRTVIDLTLAPDITALDEIVVVGYGTINKSDLTGSVGKVDADDLDKSFGQSVDQLMQGRMAGINIVQQSGAPGAGSQINVRGFNGLGDSQPLIVIDGYPVEMDGLAQTGDGADNAQNLNPLAMINPNDIASIEVLKDASSTAIYGSRGANGVLLITTKSGQKGNDQVNYNYRFGLFDIGDSPYDMLNSREYMEFRNEASLANGGDLEFENIDSVVSVSPDINWQDLIYRQAQSHDHSLSFSGGDDKNKYNLNFGYFDQEGVIINSDFTRVTFRLNASRKINDKLEVGARSTFVNTASRAAAHSYNNGNPGSNVVLGALFFRPLEKAFDEEVDVDDVAQNNPLVVANKKIDETRINFFYTNLFANYQIAKGLKFNFNGGYNLRAQNRSQYQPRGTFRGDMEGGFASVVNSENSNFLTEFTLSYNRTLSKVHSINAVAGWTYQEWQNEGAFTSAAGFLNDNLSFNNFSGARLTFPTRNWATTWGLASWLGRLNYTYDGRYILTFTGRYDGSTRLGEGNKWAFFPSGAVGWNVHRESFMESIENVSNLKLRASYGISGSQSIGVNSLVPLLGGSAYYIVADQAENGLVTGFRSIWDAGSLANPTLGWETTAQFNVGLDVGLLQDRFTFTFDYYNKETTNLLINLNSPPSSGYGNFPSNAGTVKNFGLELELGARILTGAFGWSMSGNASRNINELVELGTVDRDFGPTYIGSSNIAADQPAHVILPGQPIGMFYGYQVEGVFQTQEEINSYQQPDGSNPYSGNQPGDHIYVNQLTIDTDGDGVPDAADNVINGDDRTIIGNPYPDLIFGVQNSFSWKGFALDVLVTASIGNDIMNLNRYVVDYPNGAQSTNITRDAYYGAWRGEGTSDTYPRLYNSGRPNEGRFTSLIVEDGSFVKISNITLSYNLNTTKIGFLDGARFSVGAENAFVFSDYSGYDPEVSNMGTSAINQGIDWGGYPLPRTIFAGVNLKF